MKNFNAPAKAKVAFIIRDPHNRATYVIVEKEGVREGERKFTMPDAIALDIELQNRKVVDPTDPNKTVDAPAHLLMVVANHENPIVVGDMLSYFQPSDGSMPFMSGSNRVRDNKEFTGKLEAMLAIQERHDLIHANITDPTLASLMCAPGYARAEKIMQGNKKKQATSSVSALKADAFNDK